MTRLQQRVRRLREVTGGSTTTGCMTDQVCWLLHGLVRHQRPGVVVQTGHLWGKSALVVLEALCEETLDDGEGDKDFRKFVKKHSPKRVQGVLHSVDPNPMGVPRWQAGVDLLSEWHPNRFAFHHQTSEGFFHTAKFDKARVFGIVDGDHHIDGAKRDLYGLAAMGAQTIFLDDTSWIPHLADLTHLPPLEGYALTEFPEYNGVMVLQRIR